MATKAVGFSLPDESNCADAKLDETPAAEVGQQMSASIPEVDDNDARRSAELLGVVQGRVEALFSQAAADADRYPDFRPQIVLETLKQSCLALVGEMSTVELTSRRSSAKALARLFQSKLSSSRSAAKLSLQQQAVKLEAQHSSAMRAAALRGGGDTELLDAALARAEEAEAEADRQQKTSIAAAASLQETLEQLGIAIERNVSLEATVVVVQDAMARLRLERDENASILMHVREDAQRYKMLLDELQAEEAEKLQVSQQHADEASRALAASEAARRELEAELEASRANSTASERAALDKAASFEVEVLALRAKLADLEAKIHDALAELGIKIEENLSLTSKLHELTEQYRKAKAEATKRAATAEAEAAALRKQLEALLTASGQPAPAAAEAAVVIDATPEPDEVAVMRQQLADWQRECEHALGSAADWQRAHRQTSAELEQLGADHAKAKEALRHASEELQEAMARAMRLEESSRSERASLVKAALASLQQLRLHLVETLSGLREPTTTRALALSRRGTKIVDGRPASATATTAAAGSPQGLGGDKDGDFQYHPKKQRWGVVDAKGQFEQMTVKLELSSSTPQLRSLAPQQSRAPTFLPQSALSAQKAGRSTHARLMSAWVRGSSPSRSPTLLKLSPQATPPHPAPGHAQFSHVPGLPTCPHRGHNYHLPTESDSPRSLMAPTPSVTPIPIAHRNGRRAYPSNASPRGEQQGLRPVNEEDPLLTHLKRIEANRFGFPNAQAPPGTPGTTPAENGGASPMVLTPRAARL